MFILQSMSRLLHLNNKRRKPTLKDELLQPNFDGESDPLIEYSECLCRDTDQDNLINNHHHHRLDAPALSSLQQNIGIDLRDTGWIKQHVEKLQDPVQQSIHANINFWRVLMLPYVGQFNLVVLREDFK